MSSACLKKQSLKNFSYSTDGNTYDEEEIFSLVSSEPSEGFRNSLCDPALLEAFPDLLLDPKACLPLSLIFGQPYTEDEERAVSTQSFNSHKRQPAEKAKAPMPHLQSNQPPNRPFSAAQGYSGTRKPASVQSTRSRVSTDQMHSIPASHPFSNRDPADPWKVDGSNSIGAFDENGVFYPRPPAGTLKPSGPIASRPVFERLRDASLRDVPVTTEQPNFFSTDSGVHSSDTMPLQMNSAENLWYYRDPSGRIQGPFTCDQMQQWFEVGYFPPTLPVKRMHDPTFRELEHVVRGCNGASPFLQPQTFLQSESLLLQNSSRVTSNAHSWAVEVAPTQAALPVVAADDFFSRPKVEPIVLPKVVSQEMADKPIIPATTASLEEAILKDLRIGAPAAVSKPEDPVAPKLGKLFWDNTPFDASKVVAVPRLSDIIQETKSEPRRPAVQQQTQASHAAIGFLQGTTWQTSAKANAQVVSLEDIQRQEAKSIATESATCSQNFSEKFSQTGPKTMKDMLVKAIANKTAVSEPKVAASPITKIGATSSASSQAPKAPTAAPKKSISASSTSDEPSPHQDFIEWCKKEFAQFKFSEPVDVPTLVSLLLEFDRVSEIRQYLEELLAANPKSAAFISEFLARAKQFSKSLHHDEDDYVVISTKRSKKPVSR